MADRDPVLFDPEAPSDIQTQALAATTWTLQSLWSGSTKVYLQVVDASGNLIAFKLSASADGATKVIDIPAGSGIELMTKAIPYSIRASAAGTAQALVEVR